MPANGITRTNFRELARRATGGLEVALLWSANENRLVVTVSDAGSGERSTLNPDNDNALDVFYHPYAYAALQATA